MTRQSLTPASQSPLHVGETSLTTTNTVDMFLLEKDFETLGPNAFQDWLLIVGVPSVGHVGQLIADLMVRNGNFKKAGTIFHYALEPLVGAPLQLEANLMTSAELHAENGIAVLNLRGPIIKKHVSGFCDFLMDWIEKYKFRRVALVSSVFASARTDVQLRDKPGRGRFVPTRHVPADVTNALLTSGWSRLEGPAGGEEGDIDGLSLPGSGITKQLLKAAEERKIQCVAYLSFTSDGVGESEVVPFYKSTDTALNVSGSGDNDAHATAPAIPEEWDATLNDKGGGDESFRQIY